MRLVTLSALVAVFAIACAPGLMIARRAPPLVDAGPNFRRVSVSPQGDPVVAAQVQVALEQKLAASREFTVVILCNGEPCSPVDGWVRVNIDPVQVKPPKPDTADKSTSVTLRLTFDLLRVDGSLAQSRTRENTKTGVVDGTTTVESMLREAIEDETRGFVEDITPRTISESIELDDSGVLKAPVKQATDGDLAGAKAAFEALVAKDPNLAGAHYDLGVLAEVNGQFDLARQLYAKAAGLSSKSLYAEAAPKLERRLADGRAVQSR